MDTIVRLLEIAFADYQKTDLDLIAQTIKDGSLKPTAITLVQMTIVSKKGKRSTLTALNEVRILNNHQTLIADVFIDDEYLEKFRGNGFCVCTPSGSTAYNKSLNGSVIYHDLEIFELTEIASINHNKYHSLNAPLILTKKNKVRICPIPNSEFDIGADFEYWRNRETWLVDDKDDIAEIICEIPDQKVHFLIPKNSTFIKRLNRCFIV